MRISEINMDTKHTPYNSIKILHSLHSNHFVINFALYTYRGSLIM